MSTFNVTSRLEVLTYPLSIMARGTETKMVTRVKILASKLGDKFRGLDGIFDATCFGNLS